MHRHGLKLLIAILVAGITYTLLGSLGGSYLVEHGLRKILAGRDEHKLVLDRVLFNPFTFSARLEQLQLNDTVGTTILTIDHARLDFSIVTLLERRIVLSEVSLEQPELSLEIVATPGNSLAHFFTTLLAADGADGGFPDIRIKKGSVHEGLVFFRQGSDRQARPADAKSPFQVQLSKVNLQIDHYQSRSEEPANLVMSAIINQSSPLGLSGHLIPLSGALEAKVQLEDLDLASFSPLIDSKAAIGWLAGILRADGMLSPEADDMHFSGELAIQRLEARAAPNGPRLFSADELRLSGAEISAWPLRASVQFMELMQPHLEPGWQQMAGTAGDLPGMTVLSHWLLGVFGPAGGSVNGDTVRVPAWPPAIDAFAVTGGRVNIIEPGPAKPVHIDLDHVTGGISSRAADAFPTASRTVNMQLTATVGESGPVSLAGIVQLAGTRSGPDSVSEETSVRSIVGAIDLQQVDAMKLPDYFTGFLARDIASGTLNLDLRYRLKDDVLAIASTVSLQDLLLGERNGPAGGFDHSLELAVALLKDPSGVISFELPLLEREVDSANAVTQTIQAALNGYISDVAANPFDLLADLTGASGTVLNVVDFEPGSAAITPVAEETLRALSVALNKRPALGIHAKGGQARQADRTALARQQMQLHVALAASTRPSGRREQSALDFSDPKVQVVLDEFASERLDPGALARLKNGAVPDVGMDGSAEPADRDTHYAEVFAALVAGEQVSESALRQLARFRTQSVIRWLEDLGIATDRLQFGGTLEADDQPVSLEVFARAKPAANPPL